MHKIIAAAILSLGVTSTASAFVYMGNPDLDFKLDRFTHDFDDGDAYLNKVKVHRCDGSSVTYTENRWIVPTDWNTVKIAAGDLCGATIYWGSDIEVSNSSFTISITDNTTYLSLDPIKGAPMSNWETVSGTFFGLDPRIYVAVN